MRDFKYYILLFAGVLFMQSCLHEEEDIFGKSAAERLNEAQKLYENILTKPSNGWVLEYIAGDTDVTRRGAFNFLLKFESGTVTAAVDQNALDDIDPSMNTHKKITSLYKLEQDMSITLSFDTYNLFLHYYHEQHGSYTTYKGDFEFTIMEAYDDLIILRGKKYGNIMEMHRLPDNVTWDDYLDQINNIYNQVSEYPEFSIHQSNNQLSSGSILETRQFSFSYDGKSYLKNIVEILGANVICNLKLAAPNIYELLNTPSFKKDFISKHVNTTMEYINNEKVTSSTDFHERYFQACKKTYKTNTDIDNNEYKYWRESGLLNCNSFEDVLTLIRNDKTYLISHIIDLL